MVEVNQDILKDVGIEKTEHYQGVGFSIAAYNGQKLFVDYESIKELARVVTAHEIPNAY
jgi:hypothetical protein